MVAALLFYPKIDQVYSNLPPFCQNQSQPRKY